MQTGVYQLHNRSFRFDAVMPLFSNFAEFKSYAHNVISDQTEILQRNLENNTARKYRIIYAPCFLIQMCDFVKIDNDHFLRNATILSLH